ncbi:MAG: DUF123 domain-containing protein [Candidatus Lokiarchaeota archaeon]|nr:DUF123 domain-containing protein [Candidatus Lokiarchaeota archaeon]
MKGVYAIIIKIEKKLELTIGRLGKVCFTPGIYVYSGSAMGQGSTSLENRLKRHFSESKTIHWHIDYLVAMAKSVKAWYAESSNRRECELAQEMDKSNKFERAIKGFGSSDCKSGCYAHLYKHIGNSDTVSDISKMLPGLQGNLSTDGKVVQVEQ